MLLEITTTHQPTSDLGYLLHKHPDKFQSFDLSHGQVHVFYPELTEEKVKFCLLLDIDPIELVKGGRNLSGKGFALGHYVNDRIYVASSFMSVGISKTLSSALNGRCKDRPELLGVKMPFEVKISVLPAPIGGAILIQKLFEPLGYKVQLERHILDAKFESWGESKYYTLYLKNELTLQELLTHLYVLIPVLDNDKHYYVGKNEIDKLVARGGDWLQEHPERKQIAERYLFNLKSLSRQALERLIEKDGNETAEAGIVETHEEMVKRKTLHQKRLYKVVEKLLETNAESVLDLGCGEGKLLRLLLKQKQFKKITGMDVSFSELKKAKDKLYYDDMAPKQKERIQLFQGSLLYSDTRLLGYDAAAIVEVIEHLDENRLKSFERVIFEIARPKSVVITTPNGEYNALFPNLKEGAMRHSDHRFEWTRKEFQDWATAIAQKNNYTVSFEPIGEEDEQYGAPSQMGVFSYAS